MKNPVCFKLFLILSIIFSYNVNHLSAQTINGYLWVDVNGNGQQGINEPALNGVTVELLDQFGNPTGITDVTGSVNPGEYTLVGAGIGSNYSVSFADVLTINSGYQPTEYQTGPPDTNSDCDTNYETSEFTMPSSNLDHLDAGFFLFGSIGDKFWIDEDADGLQSVSENLPIPSGIILTADPESNEFPPTPYQTTVNTDGSYLFENIIPGIYHLYFELPAGYSITAIDAGPEDIDSDVYKDGLYYFSEGVYLNSNQNIINLDAGLVQTMTIGGNLWFDTDQNCMYDNQVDLPLHSQENNEIYLTLFDQNGVEMFNAVPDPTGYYQINNVPPGTYYFEIYVDQSNDLLENCSPIGDITQFIDNDNNSQYDSGNRFFSQEFTLIQGQQPDGVGFENYTFDFGFTLSNTLQEHPLANPDCESAIDTRICDVFELEQGIRILPSDANENGPEVLCPNTNSSTDNISWFSFVAGEGNYSIRVSSDFCLNENGPLGIEAGIYKGYKDAAVCIDEFPIECMESIDAEVDIVLDCAFLTPGEIYLLYVDGIQQSVCSYEIFVDGNQEPFYAEYPDEIICNGDENYTYNCVDSVFNFEIFNQNGPYPEGVSMDYLWRVKDQDENIIDEFETKKSNLELKITEQGVYQICIENILDNCDNFIDVDNLCFTLNILSNSSEDFGTIELCESSLEFFTGPTSVNNEGLVTDPNGDGIHGWNNSNYVFKEGINLDTIGSSDSCFVTQSVNIILTQAPTVSVVGPTMIQVGGSTQLSPFTGGTWTSNNPSVATINNSGLVTGVGLGHTTFNFSVDTSCMSLPSDTVYVVPDSMYWLSGYAYIDSNQNGVQDAGELPLPNFKVTDPITNMTYFTDLNGYYEFQITLLTSVINVMASYGEWQNNMLDFTINVTPSVFDYTQNVGFVPVNSSESAIATLSSGMLRCNTFAELNTAVTNTTNSPISGSLEVQFDPTLSSLEYDPNPQNLGPYLKSFAFNDLNPGTSFKPFIKVGVPPFFPNQDSLRFTIWVKDQTGQILDSFYYADVIRCSYDPNDKRAWPDRPGDDNIVLGGETMDYTIRFQNNGNDTAFYVQVVDPISPLLDLNSLTINESSHNMSVSIHMDTIFFEFNDILLVDSTTNYIESQGFISYSIDIKNDAPIESLINNKADIIFDQNEPIITNITSNKIVEFLPCYHIGNSITITDTTLIAEEGGNTYTWIDCDNQSTLQESDSHIFQPNYSGDFQVIIKGDQCQNVSQCVQYNLPLAKTLTLGGQIWIDAYGGCQINEETIMSDITVELLNANYQFIASTITDSLGAYQFTVPEELYYIQIPPFEFENNSKLHNTLPCGDVNDPNNEVKGDNNGFLNVDGNVITPKITLLADTLTGYGENLTIDFGLEIQCDASDNPYAWLSCSQASLNPICNLKEFEQGCGTMPNILNPVGPNPLCPNGVGEAINTSWYSFVAGSGDYDIELVLKGCVPGTEGVTGIQAGIYLYNSENEDCWGDIALDCNSDCGGKNVILDCSNLEPGSQYLMFINGCGGSWCGYEINILGDFIPYIISDPDDIQCVDSICDQIFINQEISIEVTSSLESYKELKNHFFAWSLRDVNLDIIDDFDSFGNENFLTNSSTLKYNADTTGTFYICLEYIVDICDNITVSDMCYEVEIAPVSTNDFEDDRINIYPNPTTGELTIVSNLKIEKIEIIDLVGNLVGMGDQKSININTHPSGVYIVNIYTENHKTSKRIIKL